MKTWTLKVLMITASVVLLAACSKKSKGGTAAVPPATGLCVIGANGLCSGQTIYTGSGSWKGALSIAPAQYELFRQFMMENNLCGYYGCQQPASFAFVSIRAEAGGQGIVTIRPYVNGSYGSRRYSRQAQTTSANSAAGFNMIVNNGYATNAYVAPGYPQNLTVANTMQLSAIFSGTYGEIITVTLYYRGVPVASGQLQGRRNDTYGVAGWNGQQAPGVAPYYR